MNINEKMIKRLEALSKVGFGYDLKPEDREALTAAVAALSTTSDSGRDVVRLKRCRECEGKGKMLYDGDSYSGCETCGGDRYVAALSAAPDSGREVEALDAIRPHLHLIRCFADEIHERNYGDKKLYIKQQVDRIEAALSAAPAVDKLERKHDYAAYERGECSKGGFDHVHHQGDKP